MNHYNVRKINICGKPLALEVPDIADFTNNMQKRK